MIEKARKLRQYMAKIANMQDLPPEIRQSALFAFEHSIEEWTHPTVDLAEIERLLYHRRDFQFYKVFTTTAHDLIHLCFTDGHRELADKLMSRREFELRQSLTAFLAQHQNLPQTMVSIIQESLARRHYGTQLLDMESMARELYAAKAYAVALDLLKINQAYHSEPLDGDGHELLGLVSFELGDFRGAFLYMKEALRLDREAADNSY